MKKKIYERYKYFQEMDDWFGWDIECCKKYRRRWGQFVMGKKLWKDWNIFLENVC